jgi:hypothetical protein
LKALKLLIILESMLYNKKKNGIYIAEELISLAVELPPPLPPPHPIATMFFW